LADIQYRVISLEGMILEHAVNLFEVQKFGDLILFKFKEIVN